MIKAAKAESGLGYVTLMLEDDQEGYARMVAVRSQQAAEHAAMMAEKVRPFLRHGRV